MRILIAHNVPRARTGGMSRIMGEIHDRIAARGAKVEYLCAEDVPARFRNRWQRFTFPYLVAQKARAGAFDIVNVHEPSGALVALLPGKTKVVVTSHGIEERGWKVSLDDKKLGRGGPSWKTQILYPATSLWQSRIALRRADHVFCLNEQDRAYLEGRAKAATRIYPAASPIYAEAARHRDYRRFRRVLFAGTWLTRKGNLDAVAAFAQADPSLEFVTLGAGVPADRVRADFPDSIRNRVVVLEARSDREAAEAMADADAFLLPSVFEGTPLTLMEAMYSGLPIITTDTCGMRDVVDNEKTGLLVPLRCPEAITLALNRLSDRSFREQLGRASQAKALDRYTWDRSAETVWNVYRSLMSNPER